MENRTILLAEDDENLGTLLENYLTVKGYGVTLFGDGGKALQGFRAEKFDLCIIDVMMPVMDGFELARSIRKSNPSVPVIFLTARNQKEDVIEGFITGADDYITKPFSMEELLYRIEAVLRRTSAGKEEQQQEIYDIGGYKFDTIRQLLTYRDHTIKLTTKESELLLLLCRHKNNVLERNYALRAIWIDDNYFNARSMDVYITKLRKYLRKDPSIEIINVHGKGYKLLG
ncbi:MAG: response regulator transcription factor [Bacteroidales bacterium]|jgi:DNA-binding response OmpR family regulator|nr:response regulator transcription factor [Bacteroidales bacterium]